MVTGGGSGIGAALCRALAAEDYFVIVADLDEQAAMAVAATINARAACRRAIDQLAIERSRFAEATRLASGTISSSADGTRRASRHAVETSTDEAARRRSAKLARGAVDAAKVEQLAGCAIGARCDVTSAADVEQLAGAAQVIGGAVDLWINNAGVAIGGAAQDLRLDDWQRVLDVNLRGVIHGVHAIYPSMVARGSGQIINIASVAGLAPYPFALPYTTTKHAVVGLSQALRAEARAHGVRVSVACPGMIETPIWERSTVRGDLATGRGRIGRIGKLSADACAEAILRGAAADRAVIPVTSEARIAWWLNRLSPALAVRTSSGLARIARRLVGQAG